MRRFLHVLAGCLLHPLLASAKADARYNASVPFRPSNITGLSDNYLWVGSYYNATTKIEFTPEIGPSPNQSVCKPLRGQTFSTEYESFLAITERGPYNLGSNPMNALLTLFDTGANLSSLSGASFPWDSPSLQWYIESSPWVDFASNSSTESDGATDYFVKDVFNLTLSPGDKKAPYNLTGIIKDADLILRSFDMDLKSCDTSSESSQNSITLVDRDYSNDAGWNWTYPAIELQFGSETANFTLNGYATAFPYYINRADSSKSLGPNEVQGTIKVSFSGVIDPYHSDILVNTSTVPTWQRTVGFGNNSMNIGYNSGSRGFPRALCLEAVTICFIIFLSLVYF